MMAQKSSFSDVVNPEFAYDPQRPTGDPDKHRVISVAYCNINRSAAAEVITPMSERWPEIVENFKGEGDVNIMLEASELRDEDVKRSEAKLQRDRQDKSKMTMMEMLEFYDEDQYIVKAAPYNDDYGFFNVLVMVKKELGYFVEMSTSKFNGSLSAKPDPVRRNIYICTLRNCKTGLPQVIFVIGHAPMQYDRKLIYFDRVRETVKYCLECLPEVPVLVIGDFNTFGGTVEEQHQSDHLIKLIEGKITKEEIEGTKVVEAKPTKRERVDPKMVGRKPTKGEKDEPLFKEVKYWKPKLEWVGSFCPLESDPIGIRHMDRRGYVLDRMFVGGPKKLVKAEEVKSKFMVKKGVEFSGKHLTAFETKYAVQIEKERKDYMIEHKLLPSHLLSDHMLLSFDITLE